LNATRIKICGITNKKDLHTAVIAGADAVGFVVGVKSSSRNLSTENANILIRQVPFFVNSVIVTVPKSLEAFGELCSELHPNAVQIHGETIQSNFKFVKQELPNISLIRAIRADPLTAENKALEASKNFDAILLDSYVKGKYGGTGLVHNWELSRRIKQRIYPTPLILAGGLKPENVSEAIGFVHPFAVDVSSGVEKQPGIKDQKKIYNFINCVRET
jgi:phosphoribosylanthranilate isomerase